MAFRLCLLMLFCCVIIRTQTNAHGKNARVVQCKPFMVCPETQQEVCGSDNRDYKNNCHFWRQRCKSGGLLTLKYNGPCATGQKCSQSCPLVYQPLCGDDGKTYTSICMLRVNNCLYRKSVRKVADGKCQSGCNKGCSFLYQPVCGTDDKTYSNKCLLSLVTCKDASISLKHHGACGTCMYQCPTKRDQVCGTDGKTYRNQCELDRVNCENKQTQITKKHNGVCDPCAPKCHTQYKPLCGSDKKTYYNSCYFRRRTCQQKKRNVYKLYDGQCHRCGPVCKAVKNPICASNFKTYDNECEMKRDSCVKNLRSIYKQYNGRCKSCSFNCGRTYRPVCGTDEKTYNNDCVLRQAACKMRNAMRKKHDGSCWQTDGVGPVGECAKNCRQGVNYVCGTDGQTYKNECMLSIKTCTSGGSVRKAYSGRCRSCSFNCGRTYRPVCGTDGKTYNNDCVLRQASCKMRNAMRKKHDGSCKQIDVDIKCFRHCHHDVNYVCGTDGTTYTNECMLSIKTCASSGSVRKAYSGRCRKVSQCSPTVYPTHCLKRFNYYYYDRWTGQCKRSYGCKANVNYFTTRRSCQQACLKKCLKSCPSKLNFPVCGDNNKTYKSKCHLEIASCQANYSVKFAYHGVCGGQQN